MRRPTAFDTITTPRLTLRQPRPEDAADLAAGIGNYEVARWLGAVPFPYDEADARKFIEKTQDNPGQHWLVFDRDGLVGGTGIAGELGYWMARTAWGRGYASEAAEVAIDAHFTAPGATALKSGYFLGNVRSFRVLTKLGFRPGPIIERRSVTLRQTVEMQEMEMTHAEWQALRTYRLKTAHLTIRGVEPRDGRTLQRLLDLPHDIPFPVSQPQTQDEAARYAQWYRFRGRPDVHGADLPSHGARHRRPYGRGGERACSARACSGTGLSCQGIRGRGPRRVCPRHVRPVRPATAGRAGARAPCPPRPFFWPRWAFAQKAQAAPSRRHGLRRAAICTTA